MTMRRFKVYKNANIGNLVLKKVLKQYIYIIDNQTLSDIAGNNFQKGPNRQQIANFGATKSALKMIQIKSFVFGPFQENTYVLWDETLEAVVIDPGNSSTSEHLQLKNFITQNNLQLKRLLLTHAHIDHINGNRFVFDTWGFLPEVHKEDLPYVERHKQVADMYGLPCEESPLPKVFLKEGETISFGKSKLEMIFTPGHSPGSITFYCREQKFIIAGDVLFYGSIGRTDLPGGDYNTLINSIKENLFPLGDEVRVYNGHGQYTTIGFEKDNNPFLV